MCDHRQCFLERPDAQLRVDANGAVRLHHDAVRGERLKPGERHDHPVRPRRHVREGIAADFVGDTLPGLIGFKLRDRDGRAWDDAAGRIGHVADDGSVQHLPANHRGRDRHQDCGNQGDHVPPGEPPRVHELRFHPASGR